MSRHHDITFPNESAEYREARDKLLDAEAELRRRTEDVAVLRRALPLGGALKEDYVFSDLNGHSVPLSTLFNGNNPDLLIYSFMYQDGGAACPACTSLLDSLNGGTLHIRQNLNFVVVAKAAPETLKLWSEGRGWSNLSVLSSGSTAFNAEAQDGGQVPMVNVFRKTSEGIFHTWASELFFAVCEQDQHPRHVDQIWPLWSVHDLTFSGRPVNWFPAPFYE